MRILASAIVLLALVLIAYFYGDSRPEAEIGDRQEKIASGDGRISGDSQDTDTEFEKSNSECISEALLETHPMMWEELERLDPFDTRGATISSYRGLSEIDLLDLADQRDSAAMTVLGAVYEIRARSLPDSKAVSFLKLEEEGLMSYSYSLPLSAAQIANLEESAHWYYQAALHGRLMALRHVGDQLNMMRRTPVDLGWIRQEEYDSLSRAEKSSFNAANVYNAAVYTIAPELEIGLFDEGDGFGHRMANRFSDIVPPIVEKYRNDRAELGMPPISVPKSELPPLRELERLLCNPLDES